MTNVPVMYALADSVTHLVFQLALCVCFCVALSGFALRGSHTHIETRI